MLCESPIRDFEDFVSLRADFFNVTDQATGVTSTRCTGGTRVSGHRGNIYSLYRRNSTQRLLRNKVKCLQNSRN